LSTTPPVLLWFRLDLRLRDNPALRAAAATGAPVIPVYIWAPEEEEPWPPGAASRWWLHQSLSSLQANLAARGSRLILRRGPTLQTLQLLVAETGAASVFWNRRYEPAVIARDTTINPSLRDQGIRVETFNANLLFEPWTIRSRSTQRPFQVFSAFWKVCRSAPLPEPPQNAPRDLRVPTTWPASLILGDLSLEPRINWAGGLKAAWTPGEAGAVAQLKNFARRNLAVYTSQRDFPSEPGTSRLSPHLHFGEISPRQIWHAVRDPDSTYIRELGWREFAYHILFHFPHTPDQPLRPEFAAFPWRTDARLFNRWQRGTTGYPLVDAGMRELWTTGWMHNRARMVAASFLTKHLRISWQEGAYWFWDTLVDADLANNTLGWQWSAGCGADAAPYFRIFNPVRQIEKFDPAGEYIRRWIPELAGNATDYPQPVVDHAQARREALKAYEQTRSFRSGQ